MKTSAAAALAMGFAVSGGLMAQPPAPVSTDPSLTVTHPAANPELAGASTASRQSEQLHMALAGTIAPGMQVKSPAGDVLGTVASIIPGDTDTSVKGYVVVAGSGGQATPVPYKTAATLVQHDSLVI